MTGPFRFTSPAAPDSATGVAADVYAQLVTDFGVPGASTFAVLSPSTPLMTGFWALLRESLLAGQASRTDKELVATGVSLANNCHFCINAHTLLLYAGGDHALAETIGRGDTPADPAHARLLQWGKAIGADAEPPPFPPEQAPEYIGTALTFHFINRIASALLSDNSLPSHEHKLRFLGTTAGRHLADTIKRELRPGDSLPLLEMSGPEPAWAAPGSPIAVAYGALREAALMGAGLLTEDDQAYVRKTVSDWDGVTPVPVTGDWLPGRDDRPGARLALLAALAPNDITGDDVTAWRTPQHSDHCLVHLVAYGAIIAVERVEETL
ncbi:carboxymuconolactone decarboxylase family protein [Streptomyces sp. ISL-96]|uniref:carboxymuconolactone decarboxylase family protein n=1 Tax=Streptomyces sp. ISL-96 TaxID=2819191 RepID=UPI001BE56492|nr:carboxymuconolactone decarboxylase family protein [Streptomyces sp. ISL-96]MBT2487251.1 carboxymuconolactone decarboxylase family protein [Streptomyces sp. ISL-96]